MRRRTAGRTVAVTTGLLVALSVATAAVPASASAATGGTLDRYPATVTDTDPHIKPTAAQLAMWAKQRQTRTSKRTPGTLAITAESRYLAANRQQQINWYYCGPASVSEALGMRGMAVSQSYLGYLLKTDDFQGTNWSGTNARVPVTTGFPVPDVMNYYTGAGFIPQPLPYTPTAADKTTFKNRLVSNIDAGYPLLGNAVEVVGGPHLVGHPNVYVQHWITIRGYSSWGSVTHYEDSAGSINGSVIPSYASMNSSTITTILGDRGYVW